MLLMPPFHDFPAAEWGVNESRFNHYSLAQLYSLLFFFSSRRRHTRCLSDWSSDVCSSDLEMSLTNLKVLCLCVLLLTCCGQSLPAADPAAIELVGEVLVHPAEVHGIAFSSNGKWVATRTSDSKLRVWDATTGTLHAQPLAHARHVSPVAFSPDR